MEKQISLQSIMKDMDDMRNEIADLRGENKRLLKEMNNVKIGNIQ
jgi:hypothetical protein